MVSCQVNRCLERSFWIFLGRQKSCHKETSVKSKDRKVIFGFSASNVSFKNEEASKDYIALHTLHVSSWSSAVYIYNFHLQRHFLAPPGEASCQVVCDESAGPVSSGTPRLWTPGSQIACWFTSFSNFLSWSKVRLNVQTCCWIDLDSLKEDEA